MIAARNNINYVYPVNDLHPHSRGLVAFYTPGTGFDGGSKLYDLTRSRSDMTFNGNVTWSSAAPDNGKQSLLYGGASGDYLSGPAERPYVQEHSLFAWIRPTTSGATRIIASQSNNILVHGVEWACSVSGNSRLGLAYFDGAVRGFYTSAIGTVTLNAWQFVGIVWKPGLVSFYRDGEFLSSTATTSGTIVYAVDDIFLLGDQNQNSPYGGHMSDFLLYNRAYSAREARDLYHESLNGYPGLLNWIEDIAPPEPGDSYPHSQPRRMVARNTLIRM